ncbi:MULTISPECIES: ATP-binding protein [unclassified Agarivorans]|uniref:ATP-binding protein n=1 Tax=unclassified Agarivorans TaxID=2636026 RepID=UPI0026E48EB1|nr:MULTISPECIES: ATP-binding protein [unclassified Agarivorans]MDO6687580.1 ATP-binding protein [Agarivorans sp. 3_MG-2023]MDO6717087.1 ATP-binding protein [Agarivorans sp. 2_MG-2023]
MKRLINNLFVKIFISFWMILLVTAFVSINLSKMVSEDNFRAPSWALKSLQEFAKRIENNPQKMLHPKLEPRFKGRFGKPFIVNANGEVINQTDVSRDMRRLIANHDNLEDPRITLDKKHILIGPQQVTLDNQSYLLYVERRAKPEQMHAIRNFGVSPVFLSLVAIGLSLALCFLLTRHIVRPLKKLQSAANKVSLGHLDTQLPEIHRGDEVGQLSDSLQRMVDTLNQAISNQQRLLSDISHELRSPLTRMNMALAIHKKRQEPSPEIERIERESQRLAEMINALLSLSRMQVNAKQQQLDLPDLIDDIVNDCEFEAEQLNKTFTASYPPNVSLVCYPQLLASALENVCRNALKYAEQHVSLQITQQDNELVLIIRDDGPGLNEGELESIFRPFYRSGEARDRDSGGVGLGLAIAESAVRQHGGSIRASNHSAKGLEVSLRLPLQ